MPNPQAFLEKFLVDIKNVKSSIDVTPNFQPEDLPLYEKLPNDSESQCVPNVIKDVTIFQPAPVHSDTFRTSFGNQSLKKLR